MDEWEGIGVGLRGRLWVASAGASWHGEAAFRVVAVFGFLSDNRATVEVASRLGQTCSSRGITLIATDSFTAV